MTEIGFGSVRIVYPVLPLLNTFRYESEYGVYLKPVRNDHFFVGIIFPFQLYKKIYKSFQCRTNL